MTEAAISIDHDTSAPSKRGKRKQVCAATLLALSVKHILPAAGATQALAFQVLLLLADSDGFVKLSASQLASRLGLSTKMGYRLFAELRKHGFIQRVSGGYPGATSTHKILVSATDSAS